MRRALRTASAAGRREQRRQHRFVAAVDAHPRRLRTLSGSLSRRRVREVRARLGAEGFVDEAAAEAFALVREATRRTLGKAQFHTQLIAARIMLGNRLAEMATGEGKTLAAAARRGDRSAGRHPGARDHRQRLPGRARRRAARAGVRARSGLTVGAVTRPLDQAQRRAAYGCDITYCTAKELVFDYLRDRLVRRTCTATCTSACAAAGRRAAAATARLLLRGLCMAVIDEADSILIDEARTPLILSQPRVNPQQQRYVRAGAAASPGTCCGPWTSGSTLRHRQRGSDRSGARPDWRELRRALGGLWQDRRHRDEIVALALAAHHLYHRDRHYLVRDAQGRS